MTPVRARVLVLSLAVVAYANTLGNGFAIDDEPIVATNSVVTEGRWGEALLGPYWSTAPEGAGLWRPVTVAAFTVQHAAWGGGGAGYHAVNVALHAGVSLLVLALLLGLAGTGPALAGAALFALHPVHTEAVANVVGASELLAAGAVLLACLLTLARDDRDAPGAPARTAAVLLLYLAGLGAKESAVTLPALLVLLHLYRPDDRPVADRLRASWPLVASCAAVLVGYLAVRASVLGSPVGEVPAPWLRDAAPGTRVATALAAWVHYARLLVFPLDLVSDYAPGVTAVHHGPDAMVVLGAATLAGLAAVAWTLRRSAPLVALGAAWTVVALLPVSNLVVPTGVLLAERVLYLPSVGTALAVTGGGVWLSRRAPRMVGPARSALVVVAALFLIRTVARNPSWESTQRALATLAAEHPESYVAVRARAGASAAAGDTTAALAAYDDALRLAPGLYALTVEAGALNARARRDERGEALLREAAALRPDQPAAWRLLAEVLLRTGRGREAHSVALRGLAAAGPDRELWSLLSETYIAKGDLEAAVRARRAALGVDPGSTADRARLDELLRALGRE